MKKVIISTPYGDMTVGDTRDALVRESGEAVSYNAVRSWALRGMDYADMLARMRILTRLRFGGKREKVFANGKTLKQMSAEKGYSCGFISQTINRFGVDAYEASQPKQPPKRKAKKNHKKPKSEEIKTQYEKEHLCKCPRCGKTHKKLMFWTGTGTPRFYCYTCKNNHQPNMAAYGVTPCGRSLKIILSLTGTEAAG